MDAPALPFSAGGSSAFPPSSSSSSSSSISSSAASHTPRETKREREKLSRQRRAIHLKRMSDDVKGLEHVALTLRLVADPDEVWDSFLDDETKRIRAVLRQLSPATREASALREENARLGRAVAGYDASVRALRQIVESEARGQDWPSQERRWRTLARVHFRPWTMDQCVAEMDAATQEMNRYYYASGSASADSTSFMGWEDSCPSASPGGAAVHFIVRKAFANYDLAHRLATSWRIYTEPALYRAAHHGDHGDVSVDIVQELTPTVLLVRYVQSSRDRSVNFHRFYLVARVETEDGVIQYTRSIHAPQLQKAVAGPHDVWVSDFLWIRWDITDHTKPRSCTDYRTTVGGVIPSDDSRTVSRCLIDVLAALVRVESMCTRQPLLDFSDA